ncbi:MAG: hypothetical protein WBC53_11285 [Phycisphaerae bacterium]
MMWYSLVSVLVGGLLVMATHWLIYYLNNRRTRRATAGAFAGEIGAICSIMRHHRYLEDAQSLLEEVCRSGQPLRAVMYSTQEYFVIYHSNSSAIGLLPAPLALKVARFYTQVKSLMDDARPEAPASEDAEDAKNRLKRQIKLLTETRDIGEDLEKQLQKIA